MANPEREVGEERFVMSRKWRIVIVAALLAAVGVVLAFKGAGRATPSVGSGDTERALPTLVELDGGSCETCREMRPMVCA